MGRYRWIFTDKGTVTVNAENKRLAMVEIIDILGHRPKKGRLIRLP